MPVERPSFNLPEGVPAENFARGLQTTLDLPERFGEKIEGKVGEMWVVGDKRIVVRTDRVSAYNSIIGSVPGKGEVLTCLSAYWLNETEDVIPNHFVALPHPYVMIVKNIPDESRLPIEVIYRDYIARTKSPTSVWKNHQIDGKRTIYGYEWPEEIRPNQKIEDGTKLTPTTKSKDDEMLTPEEAREITDSQFGEGTWDKITQKAEKVFKRGSDELLRSGIILADTKMEFGLDEAGNWILIDELFTPDSSRLWVAGTYPENFGKGIDPQNYDKEIVRKALAETGYTGEGPVPTLDPAVVDQMTSAYTAIYRRITGEVLPPVSQDPQELAEEIKDSIVNYFK